MLERRSSQLLDRGCGCVRELRDARAAVEWVSMRNGLFGALFLGDRLGR